MKKNNNTSSKETDEKKQDVSVNADNLDEKKIQNQTTNKTSEKEKNKKDKLIDRLNTKKTKIILGVTGGVIVVTVGILAVKTSLNKTNRFENNVINSSNSMTSSENESMNSSDSSVILDENSQSSSPIKEKEYYTETGDMIFESFDEFIAVEPTVSSINTQYSITLYQGQTESQYLCENIYSIKETPFLAYIIGKNEDDNYTIKLINMKQYLEDPHNVKDYVLSETCDITTMREMYLIPYNRARIMTERTTDIKKKDDGIEVFFDTFDIEDVYDMADKYLETRDLNEKVERNQLQVEGNLRLVK